MKKILIIDDDPDTIGYLESLFVNAGYATCAAYNGAEGLEKVRSEKPDLITLDMDMPLKGGTMFFVGLRKESDAKHIPVIVISGVGPRPPSLTHDIPTVTKPIDREHLLSLVAERVAQGTRP
ncbi:MAG: response regulator [Thermodesulfobacteriota bacterium]